MKILHIIASYKPAYIYGGPIMSTAFLCEELSQAGVWVEVFTTTANGLKELPVIPNKPVTINGVRVTYFKRITKDHTHFSPALLKALWIRVREFDAVHIHAWWNLVSILSCLVAVIKKIPVVLSPRGTLSAYSFTNKNSRPKKIIHKTIGRYLLTKCYFHVTSVREENAILLLKKSDPHNIAVIPNFVKLSGSFTASPKQIKPSLQLLFFSRIEEKKGLDLLLHALLFISAPFHLTIAGDGNEHYIRQLKNIAVKNNLQDKITWAGFCTEGKFDLLQQHDLLVLPSHDENFGNVVIESLSVGTAVLISRHVGLADYITQKKLGWVCETDPHSISRMINNIAAKHTNDLNRISTIAPDIVRKDFTGPKLMQQYFKLYQKIIKT